MGGALKFDGDSDFIECGPEEGLDVTGGATIAAWVKLSKSSTNQTIAGKQDNLAGGYKLSIFSDKAEFEVRDAGNALRNNRFVFGGAVLLPGVWYHIVGTYSQGESIKTYVNAQQDREQQTTCILAASAGPLKIGCESFSGEHKFNGLMDDLRIYNYPLAQTEITALYSGQAQPTTAQTKVSATVEEGLGASNRWISPLVILIIAVAAVALAVRKNKTEA